MRAPLLLLTAALAASAAEPRKLDGDQIALAGGVTSTPFTIGLEGARLHAQEPAELTGALLLTKGANSKGGLEGTVIPRSLRGVVEDDWRKTQKSSGTHRDLLIDFPTQAFWRARDRAKFGIGGNDNDWDDFSIQWDGWLRVLKDGTDLATRSDDGSRVWIDRDSDGKIGRDEWGSNGWGNGQGATIGVVHRDLAAGVYRIRVQYEEGGGGNAMQLLWSDPENGTDAGAPWRVVPAEGFVPVAEVAVDGPVTIRGPVTGPGTLTCGDGVHLAGTLTMETLQIDGEVVLDADLALDQTRLLLAAGSHLSLAGHKLAVKRLSGSGALNLGGGRLELPAGSSDVLVGGEGELQAGGLVRLGRLGSGVRLSGGAVRTGDRSVARVVLAAPLTTVIPVAVDGSGPRTLEVVVDVPPDAPAGLGIGAWRADRQGRWFQQVAPGRLAVGRQTVRFVLDDQAVLAPEGHRGQWSADAAIGADRVGLFLFAETPSNATIVIDARLAAPPATAAAAVPAPVAATPEAVVAPVAAALAAVLPVALAPATAAAPALADLDLDGLGSDGLHGRTGKRWHLTVRPVPYPADPFDPDEFSLVLTVVQPGGVMRQFNGFHDEPAVGVDRGDREDFVTTGAPRFNVRFRPLVAGRHHLRLTATWRGRPPVAIDLPDLLATGAPWDDIVRVDAGDPRFFSANGAFVWPAGCNLNSTYDVRSKGALKTVLTPDRGSFTRGAYLERLAAGGGTGCETWLSPWNLGLEWIPDWPGFRGAGRYHMGHAWAFDRFLDRAEELGMRVNVSIFNHGMARDGGGAEEDWKYHPYNAVQGGWLDKPVGLFNDPRAFASQQKLFRYLAARYGDSPALLGWKLWAEVNLAHAPNDDVVAWHARASAALHGLDPWNHPVTSHWCADWKAANRAIIAHPTIDYATIDAYHGGDTAIGDLLNASTRDPLSPTPGLSATGKPILVTEFGGSAGGTSQERMVAEASIGPWAGLVSGHAGSPMLWWFEWLDQGQRFGMYGAINRFIAGEDLRGKDAECIAPSTIGDGLWCRAWSRPGRMLGYLLDRPWSLGGGEGRPIEGAVVMAGEDVKAGGLHIEWWDVAKGEVIAEDELTHKGGRLELKVPAFRRHIAFKLWRL